MKTRRFFRLVAAAVLTASGVMPTTLAGAAALGPTISQITSNHVPGEVIVKFKPTVAARERAASVGAKSSTIKADLKHDWVQVRLAADQAVEMALAAYRSDPKVEHVQPNYIYHATAVPDDPKYGELWAFKNTGQVVNSGTYTPNAGTSGNDMNIEPAWGHITDCSSVVVAVVDSGVNYNQEDLATSMWNGNANHGWDYADSDSDPMDLNGHGTHVAGIVGAEGNNSVGTTGVCWKAAIMAVRVLDASGSGTTASIIQGIDFAVSNGANVINMSLGGAGSLDQLFSDAITRAQSSDVVVIVAAGNEANNNDVDATYPCNFTHANLLCVAALDQNYALANFSNWGATSVDVGAPGTNIQSSWAGSSATIADPLTAGWVVSSTTGGGWFYSTIGSTQYMVDAANYPDGQYNNSTDDRAYKTFNLAGVDAALLQFYAAINVKNGDYFRIGYAPMGSDPFASGGLIAAYGTNLATYPYVWLVELDISGCISANCSLGFQLQSDASLTDRGVATTGFSIQTLTLSTASYKTANGTSMASPAVAGLAAMLRAYNPQYTYADTLKAIKNGGKSIAALAGRTTTGKAVDAMSSLAYIAPPGGLTATVQ